jgi:curli biogenesis system outer membrane secretion channel CsgG
MPGKILATLLIVCTVMACATAIKYDPTAFLPDKGEPEKIPQICKAAYEASIPRVAVVNFTNNTTFDYAKMVQSHVQGDVDRTRVGAAGAAVGPGVAGVVWGEKDKTRFNKDSTRTEREINVRLSESVEDGVVDEIVNMGGAKVYTRSEMKKILDEHKFQQSGLVNDSQLVQLGKLAGVKYLFTGSVNNVNLTYKTFSAAKEGAQRHLGLVGSVLAAGMETQEGWNIETEITLRILEVETGEIVFSKKVLGREIIGKMPYPNYDALIGGIKKAASYALRDARPQLSKWFTVKGYIIQTRTSSDGKERSALVTLGEQHGIKAGSKLFVFTFEEIRDPFSNKSTCDIVRLPVDVIITDQVQAEKSWALISGDPNAMKRVRAGQLVERAPIK